jgi:hypothetical protein
MVQSTPSASEPRLRQIRTTEIGRLLPGSFAAGTTQNQMFSRVSALPIPDVHSGARRPVASDSARDVCPSLSTSLFGEAAGGTQISLRVSTVLLNPNCDQRRR